MSQYPSQSPPPPAACEVLFVSTDSRLALNIHGDCQPVANTKVAGWSWWDPGPAQARGRGGGVQSCGTPTPTSPHKPHRHRQPERRSERHRCRRMQMYRRRHQLAWHIWRPRGRRVTYNRIPSCTPPPHHHHRSLPPSHPDAQRTGLRSLKTRTHNKQNICS